MKKNAAVDLGLIICIIAFTIFTYGGKGESRAVATLIGDRIETLNRYYNHGLDIEDAKKKLTETEYGELLKTDIENMEKIRYTEVDVILGYDIKIKEIDKSAHGILRGTAEIKWAMDGLTGRYSVRADYSFAAENRFSGIKLTGFKKI